MLLRICLTLLFITTNSFAAELGFFFKSPSFSGIGYSSHIQTIENTEKSRKEAIKSKHQAEIDKALADYKGTNLQKFLNNFESRVYAQLSTQLVNSLFGENAQDKGTIDLGGNIVNYMRSGDTINLIVHGKDGSVTHIEIPVGQLKF
jgi:hypothetical protein